MSLKATSPLAERSNLSSLSRNSIAPKSAPPTPTMMIDMGRREASTIAVRVWSMSVITPSVMMSSTKYCCRRRERKHETVSDMKYKKTQSVCFNTILEYCSCFCLIKILYYRFSFQFLGRATRLCIQHERLTRCIITYWLNNIFLLLMSIKK